MKNQLPGMQQKVIIVILFLFSPVFTGLTHAVETKYQKDSVVFEIHETKKRLGFLHDYIYLLEDSLHQMNLKEVRASKNFQLYFPFVDSAGYFNNLSAYWVKFFIKSNLKEDSDWLLSFSVKNSYIDLYSEQEDGSFSLKKGGEFLPLSEREFKKRSNLFSLHLPAGATKEVVAKIRRINNFTPRFDIELYSWKFLEEQVEDETNTLISGFLQGAIWLMSFCFFIFFLTTRDKANLYYAAFLFMAAVYHLDNKYIYAIELFLGDYLVLKPYVWVLSYLQFLFFALFVRNFINAPEVDPKWDTGFKVIIWGRFLSIICSLLILLFSFNVALVDKLLISFLIPLELICWSILIPVYFLKGNKIIRFFLSGAAMFIIFNLLISGVVFHTAIDDQLLDYIEPVGLVFQFLFFSSALGYRSYNLNIEKNKARQEYIDQLHENERLQTKANKELEKKVKERTARIEVQKDTLIQQSKQLKELDRLKSRFFANISHEFRAPLTLMLTPLQQMYEQAEEPSLRNQYSMMIRNGRSLLNLINQLLELSKHEAGKLKLNKTKTDITALVKYTASSYSSLAESKNINFTCQTPDKQILANIDPKQIKIITDNLLSNAFKFTPDHGKVQISLVEGQNKEGEETFNIMVEDTGIGIPEDKVIRIFERFYQINSSISRDYEGTGIGLALVKELLHLHEGTIRVESREGKGSKFSIQVPVGNIPLPGQEYEGKLHSFQIENEVPPLPIPPDEEKEEEYELKDKNLPEILLVEDNYDLRKYLKTTLMNEYKVIEAENGNKGLSLAKIHIPDLIISDLMMPGISGLEVCKKIKEDELTSHIPVIMLTAKADMDAKIAGLSVGVDDYITKPFEINELAVRVNNLLVNRKKVQEKYANYMFSDHLSSAKNSVDELFLQKLHSALEGRYKNPHLQVEDLTKDLAMSRSQLYRKLRSLTGDSPNAYIRKFRLHKAARLLKERYGSVAMVSDATGFNNDSYFSKCFQKEFGHLPSEHLNMARK